MNYSSRETRYENIKQRIFKEIEIHFGIKPEEITMEKTFVDDFDADSLDCIELAMALEEEFGINISDETMEKVGTVKGCVDYISQVARS